MFIERYSIFFYNLRSKKPLHIDIEFYAYDEHAKPIITSHNSEIQRHAGLWLHRHLLFSPVWKEKR